MILTSKSLSRAGVVQILSMWTSKSAPTPPVFKDFDFQIALARRRGANFVDILDSRSFATPVFRTYLCELSKRQNYGKTQHFAQFLPAKTSLLSNIDAARPTGNFQYSRKLELLNFLWWIINNLPAHVSAMFGISCSQTSELQLSKCCENCPPDTKHQVAVNKQRSWLLPGAKRCWPSFFRKDWTNHCGVSNSSCHWATQ